MLPMRDEKDFLGKVTEEIKKELIEKISDYSSINKCKKIWNKQACNVSENSPEILLTCNDMLYPNVLTGNENLSDKEKIVLCALIYVIQTRILEKYTPDMRYCNTNERVQEVQNLRELIYTAVKDATVSCLPEIREKLETMELPENKNFLGKFQLTLGFLTPRNNDNGEKEPLIKSEEEDAAVKCKCFGVG